MSDSGPRVDRFPGYDVMAKRNSLSWNDKTREVVDKRLNVPREPRFLTPAEFAVLEAIADRIIPQPDDRPRVPLAALVDDRLVADIGDGFRSAGSPRLREAWRQGLAALETEMQARYDRSFTQLDPSTQDLVLKQMQKGELDHAAWGTMTAKEFFKSRLAHDIATLYYAHPAAWSEMGFGGPAAPRGYVRMGYNERDSWEAAEASEGKEDQARKDNARVGR